MAQTQLLRGQSGLPVDNPTNSYWHKEPSKTLLGHRTTTELPRSADVVIVGSGITGAFAAHFLKEKQPDLNVVMLEAREACWGATGRNGGHCQPAIYAASAPHIASFELRNYSYLKNLVEEFSIPCDWRSTSGVHAFYNEELFSIAKGYVADLSDKYPDLAANVAVVTKGTADDKGLAGTPAYLLEGERRELTLDGLRVPDADGAIVQWNAASLWPYKLVAFVLERLLAANGDGEPSTSKWSFNLQTSTPATGLSPAEPAPAPAPGSASSPAPSPLWTVQTPRGAVAAPRVLLATNAYTSHLLPRFADLIVPTRGQVSALQPPQEPSAPSDPPLDIAHTYYVDGERDAALERADYLIQRPPAAALLVYGGGRHHAAKRGVGVWDDSSVDEPVAWYLRGELGSVVDLSLRRAGGAGATDAETETDAKTESGEGQEQGQERVRKQDLQPTHEWTGIMGYSRDGHPWVGGVPDALGGGEGLYLCAGYTGHGMPNAVLGAKAAVDMMCDGDAAEVDLPPEYELTEPRVAAARLEEEVAVADAKGSLYCDFGMPR